MLTHQSTYPNKLPLIGSFGPPGRLGTPRRRLGSRREQAGAALGVVGAAVARADRLQQLVRAQVQAAALARPGRGHRHQPVGEQVGGCLVVHPPAAEVAPSLLPGPLHREPDRLQAVEPLLELLVGERDRRVGPGVGWAARPCRCRPGPAARGSWCAGSAGPLMAPGSGRARGTGRRRPGRRAG
jgi:hypothetical protein